MPQAKPGSTVLVHYTGMLNDGTVFETTAGREPFRFTIGQGSVIPGFEDAVIGMSQGESRKVIIPADRAFGPKLEKEVIHLDKDRLPMGSKSDVDQKFTVSTDEEEYSVTVIDGQLTVDTNPLLAGKDLVFTIELVEIV